MAVGLSRQHALDLARIGVVNPASSNLHIHPAELRDRRYANLTSNSSAEELSAWARYIRQLVEAIDAPLGSRAVTTQARWFGRKPTGSPRFIGRWSDLWKLNSYLFAADFPLTAQTNPARAAVLSGMGGIGKTLLAEEFALKQTSAFPGGIYWLSGSPTPHPPVSARGQGGSGTAAGPVVGNHRLS
jgi:hypothetical protein